MNTQDVLIEFTNISIFILKEFKTGLEIKTNIWQWTGQADRIRFAILKKYIFF